jgi:hypothetical protein
VIDALRCATEIQSGMADDNAEIAAEKRIEFRVGVHQSDIVAEDGDIFGDGVNVAARLEGLADPGGICVSARVQEDVAGKLGLTFEDLGEQTLKNIARPVRVYALRPEPAPSAPPAPLISRSAVAAAIKKLVEIMEKGVSEQAQLMAANSLLDRGWGKPTQPLAGDPEGSALIDEHEAAILAEILRVASAGSESGADKDAE